MIEDSLDAADPFDPNDTRAAELAARTTQEETLFELQMALRARREAYFRLFSDRALAGDSRIVLDDLKRFCRGTQTPWDADQRVHALLTGRFEVFARIDQHLRLSFDELWELYNGVSE